MMKVYFVLLLLITRPLMAQVPSVTNSNGWSQSSMQEVQVVTDSVSLEKVELKEEDKSSKRMVPHYESEVEGYREIRTRSNLNPMSRSAAPTVQGQMDQKASQLMELDPNRIETKVLYYDAGNYDARRAVFLQEALTLNTNHKEALYLWAANAMVTGDTLTFSKTLNTLIALDFFPTDVICYAEDVLLSVPQGYTLITHGRLDTYGFLGEQFKRDRKDVLNVSMELLQSPQYRTQLGKHHVKLPSDMTIDISYLKELIRLNPNRKFALSMTLPKPYFFGFEEELTPNGLVFLYQQETTMDDSYRSNLTLNSTMKFLECDQKKEDSYRFLLSNYLPMLMFLETTTKNHYNNTKAIETDIEQKKQRIKKAN